MDAHVESLSPALPPMPRMRLLHAWLQEARAECLRFARTPSFFLPTLLFPAVFYLMFGVLVQPPGDAGLRAARYLLASYATFGVIGPGLFGFGVALAIERENGLLELRRALPMQPMAYLFGKTMMAVGVAMVVVLLLIALAVFVAGVRLDFVQATSLFAVEALGTMPFCAMGLLLGTLVRGSGAPALINLLYLPMAFLSGLWFPLTQMPLLAKLAPAWPSWHLNQLALSAVGARSGAGWLNVLVLAGFTLVFIALAARRLRRHG